MSRRDNQYQAERWLLTAREDLRAAEALARAEMYAQACFYCQQAAEKAVKALWYAIDADPWGHSVKRLILDYPEKSRLQNVEMCLDKAGLLDQYYIPTRYPNGLPDLTPGQIYGKNDARECLAAAEMMVDACDGHFKSL
jgi:HEPN domain-containing protein